MRITRNPFPIVLLLLGALLVSWPIRHVSAQGMAPAAEVDASPSPADAAPPVASAARPVAPPRASQPSESVSEVDAGTKPKVAAGSFGIGPAPAGISRDTPRETVQGFLEAAAQEDWERAAYFLHLRSIRLDEQRTKAPVVARQLAEVLDRKVWFDLESISDVFDERVSAGRTAEMTVATIEVPRGSQGIRLARVPDAYTGRMVWLFSASTVQAVDKLHDLYGMPEIVQDLPDWMRVVRFLDLRIWQWAGLIVLGLIAWFVGFVLEHPALWLLRTFARRRAPNMGEQLAQLASGPGRLLLSLLVFLSLVPSLRLSATASTSIERVIYLGLIYVGMQVAIRLVGFAADFVQSQALAGDGARLAMVSTRVTAMRRIAMVIIIILGIAAGFMLFPAAHSVGISLLGSAGLAGAILGFAAQKTFANLFAGILISFTQPIRIGDTLIVEGEWGIVEEIGATHVAVRIWDLRRLVLPVTYFLDKPFQNWTKPAKDKMGTVFVYADYNVSVEEVRAQVDRILEGDPLWDGKAKTVVVHELTDKVAVLRVTVSAVDSEKLWDLRCNVREKLLGFLQSDASLLPRWRVDRSEVRPTDPPT